jgi:hypothetical protein
MTAFETFTVISISFTAALGVYNLIINLRSQRKTHRELIFTKQFDFFMELQSHLTEIESKANDLFIDTDEFFTLRDEFDDLTSLLDKLVDKNELIIPDSLYTKINSVCTDYLKFSGELYSNPSVLSKGKLQHFFDIDFNLVEDIREYIGLEHLSNENRKLVNGRNIKEEAKRRVIKGIQN